MSDNITPEEISERERLLELQSNSQRWFSQEEFDRLKYLSSKMFQNSGSPHITPPPHTMSDKRLTAVSWLEERFEKYLAWQEGHPKATPYTLNELSNDFQQAKALEREQIEELERKFLENMFVCVAERLPQKEDADDNGFVDVVYYKNNTGPYIEKTRWEHVNSLFSKKIYWRSRFKMPPSEYFTKTYGDNVKNDLQKP